MVTGTFFGFDSAWTDRVPGAICSIRMEDEVLTRFHPPRLCQFEDARLFIENQMYDAQLGIVAIDQPTIVPNDKGMRPVERVAASLVRSLKGGVQPANRRKASMFGKNAPIWSFLHRLDARENPFAARSSNDGLFVMEVFPALSLPSIIPEILERGRAAKYNPATSKFVLGDWQLVASGVATFAELLGATPVAEHAQELSFLQSPTKGDQDKLDSIICLCIGLSWRKGPSTLGTVIGDSSSGYMVTITTPDAKRILTKAAQEKDVAIDQAWTDGGKRQSTQTRHHDPSSYKHASAACEPSPILASDAVARACPECGYVFQGRRWTGIDAHWKAKHEHIMSYTDAWPIIRVGRKPSDR